MTALFDAAAPGAPVLTWVSLFTIAGVLAGGGLFLCAGGRLSTSRRTMYTVVLAAVLGGVLGARLFHLADYWEFYADAPLRALYLWEGGLSLWGGVLCGLASGLARAKRCGLSVPRTADAAAAPGLAGLAVGRVGDLLAGERPAEASSLPWALRYANEDAPAFAGGAGVHPVPLYEIALDMAIAAFVLRYSSRLPPGAVMAAALGAWAAGRFLIGFVRVEPERLGLQQTQWVALAVLVCAALWAWRSRRRLRFHTGP